MQFQHSYYMNELFDAFFETRREFHRALMRAGELKESPLAASCSSNRLSPNV